MTERGRQAVTQSPGEFRVGPSRMRWQGGELIVDIDEISTPHLSRIRGQVRVTPAAVTDVELVLDGRGAHVWRPFAPTARIAVEIDRPGWQWQGHGYLDANFGSRALEDDFSYWTWARMPVEGGTAAFYDADRRDGSALEVALMFGPDGEVTPIADPPPLARMRRGLWTVRRQMRADPGTTPRQAAPMLDAPFYCRSVVRSRIGGQDSTGVHEALDLDRFASRWIKPMLALRVPRRTRF
jgi:carotenoid 1,2-hydratase